MNDLVIVSGLPRSGTSLLMQMLVAGGMPALTDEVRPHDINNLRGYFEYEPVKRLARDNTWLVAARGKAVKIITQLLPFVPRDLPCRILMLERPLVEVLLSQARMLAELGRPVAASADTLATVFARQRENVLDEMSSRPAVAVHEVGFHALVRRDPVTIHNVAMFAGWPGLDEMAMLNAIDPSLYRSRAVGTTSDRPDP